MAGTSRNLAAWKANTEEVIRRICMNHVWDLEWIEDKKLVEEKDVMLHVIGPEGQIRRPHPIIGVGRFFFVKYLTEGRNSFSTIFQFSPYDVLEV